MCVFINMHMPVSITVCVTMPAFSSCPPDSPTVLTLASTYAAGMVQVLAREEMKGGTNERERGHRCQRRRRATVSILSCIEHMGGELRSQRWEKERGRWKPQEPSKQLSRKERKGECQVFAGAWLSGGGMVWCHSV